MVIKRWTEVEDTCFGPDKKNGFWQMFLLIHHYTKINRHTKRGIVIFTKRQNDVAVLTDKTKKGLLVKLRKFLRRAETVNTLPPNNVTRRAMKTGNGM